MKKHPARRWSVPTWTAALALAWTLTVALWASLARADAPPSVAILDARGDGVAPESATAVTRQLYATLARAGYRVVPASRTALVASGIATTDPTPADLLQVARQAHATHALATTVGAADGQYTLSLVLANADGTGPFTAKRATDAARLEATADELARTLLPPPPLEAEPAALPPESGEVSGGTSRIGKPAVSRLAIQTEGAFGLTQPTFYNHLVGVRYDYGFPGNLALGGFLGYVNLKGKSGRAGNVLPYLQLEYRLHGASLQIPLRFAGGYLPNNGPFLRLAAGLGFPIGKTTHLEFDIVAPTFWVVRDSTNVSMDLAAEIAFDL